MKFLFATGALAAVILPLQVQAAPDNAEQAKMREALRRMMESNPPESRPVTAVAPPAAPAAVPTAAPIVPAAAPKKPMFGAVPPPSQPGVAPVVPPPTMVIPPPAAAGVVVQSEQVTFGRVPPPDDSANLAQAREVMRQKVRELAVAQSLTNPLAPAATAYTAIQVPVRRSQLRSRRGWLNCWFATRPTRSPRRSITKNARQSLPRRKPVFPHNRRSDTSRRFAISGPSVSARTSRPWAG